MFDLNRFFRTVAPVAPMINLLPSSGSVYASSLIKKLFFYICVLYIDYNIIYILYNTKQYRMPYKTLIVQPTK